MIIFLLRFQIFTGEKKSEKDEKMKRSLSNLVYAVKMMSQLILTWTEVMTEVRNTEIKF